MTVTGVKILLYSSILKISDENSMTRIASDVVYEWIFDIRHFFSYRVRLLHQRLAQKFLLYKSND